MALSLIFMSLHRPNYDLYRCNICGLFFPSLEDVKKHSGRHPNVSLGRLFSGPCPICGINSTYLPRHQRMHTGERPYKCPKCPQKFSLIGNLKVHQSVHGDVSHICADCGKPYKSLKMLKAHKAAIHSKEDRNKYSCQDCDATFRYQPGLSLHRKKHQQTFSCTKCSSSFAYMQTFKAHVRRKHGGGATVPAELIASKA